MIHTRLWAAAGIIAAVVIVGFILSMPRNSDGVASEGGDMATSSMPVVKVRDAYSKGVHTITGSILAPNACATVAASATLEGDASNTARILLSISLPIDTGICLQVPTNIPFETKVSGPASVPITVILNGEVASSTPS